MAIYLRKIKKPRWEPNELVSSLICAGDVPADNLAELGTKENKLSLWQVVEDLSNLHTIVAAFATVSDSLDKFDYALVDSNQLSAAGLSLVPSHGDTKDTDANQKWHADLVELTGKKLITFAIIVFSSKRERISESAAKTALIKSIQEGRFTVDVLKPNVRDKALKLLGQGE